MRLTELTRCETAKIRWTQASLHVFPSLPLQIFLVHFQFFGALDNPLYNICLEAKTFTHSLSNKQLFIFLSSLSSSVQKKALNNFLSYKNRYSIVENTQTKYCKTNFRSERTKEHEPKTLFKGYDRPKTYSTQKFKE
jgi:hypothetical protein